MASLTSIPEMSPITIRDDANFINFCVGIGQELTNGLQITKGSCNGIVMVLPCFSLQLIRGTNSSKESDGFNYNHLTST